jgi:hypothetical protein
MFEFYKSIPLFLSIVFGFVLDEVKMDSNHPSTVTGITGAIGESVEQLFHRPAC